MSLSHTLGSVFVIALFALLCQTANAAGSGGGGIAPVENPRRALSPEEQSAKLFRSGLKAREKALAAETKADKARSDKARAKQHKRAQKQWTRAIDKQGQALKIDPRNYKAANELGYALRKTGDFRKAIGAYNYALEVNPNFYQATEYRAQAFLALGMLDMTKRSYLVLFRNNRPLADELMNAIDAWIGEKQGNMSESELAFTKWIEERKRIADIASRLGIDTPGAEGHTWPAS